MEALSAPADFAEQLRARRQAERISTHRLADRSRVSAAMICQIENGRSVPTLATAQKIAAGCGATLTDFLQPRDAGFDPPPNDRGKPPIPEEGSHHARSNPIVHRR
jgi:transcriptional regulator with XRE-family HTH domain